MIRSVARTAFFTVISLATLVLVSGCQTIPDPLIIDVAPIQQDVNDTVSDISITDARSHNYLYRQLNNADKAAFVSTRDPLAATVKHALQGVVDRSSEQPLRWLITIDNAVVEGELSALKYRLTHHIVLRVEAVGVNRRFTNTFTGHAESESVGRPDAAVIEREFSRLLTQVLRDIINDPQLRLIAKE